MKIPTILAAASYLTSRRNVTAENLKTAIVTVLFFLIPALILVLQNETGVALVYLGIIPVVLFWSGLLYGISLLFISPAFVVYFTILYFSLSLVVNFLFSFELVYLS